MFGYSIDEEREFHESVAYGMILCSIPTLISLLLVHSPFGKHAPEKNDKSKWWLGPLFPARVSWFIFEIVNVVWATICWSQRNVQTFKPVNGFLLLLFVVHYINRAIVYPIRMKESKPMPFLVVFCALMFCTFNG
jgi:3-oxo-5-alpha-steroid 4-dehydrogenase 1